MANSNINQNLLETPIQGTIDNILLNSIDKHIINESKTISELINNLQNQIILLNDNLYQERQININNNKQIDKLITELENNRLLSNHMTKVSDYPNHIINKTKELSIINPNKMSNRVSVTATMTSKNSLGYLLDDLNDNDENDIIKDNINELIKYIRLPYNNDDINSLNTLFIESIECITSIFHLRHTLNDSLINKHNDLFHIYSIVMKTIIDLINDSSLDIDSIPYPRLILLKSFPDYIERSDGIRGWLPLHWYLISSNPTIDHITRLYELYDNKSIYELTNPINPLSLLISSQQPEINIVYHLISLNESLVSFIENDGSIPFMHACSINTSTNVIDMLYNRHPKSIDIVDKFGCYAIHYACYSGYYPVVQYLLSITSTLATFPSGNGALPLHEAVQNIINTVDILELVKSVYTSYPLAISMRDGQGALPLHLACRMASFEVVEYIYSLYDKAVEIEDNEGLQPMHYASQRPDKVINIKVVDFIVSKTPNKLSLSSTTNNLIGNNITVANSTSNKPIAVNIIQGFAGLFNSKPLRRKSDINYKK